MNIASFLTKQPRVDGRALTLTRAIHFWILCTAACGGPQKINPRATDTQNATVAYREAMADFRDEDCLSAEPLFKDIAKKYPYSRYAAQAELRVGDCQMLQGKHQEAIVTYEEFIRKRPTHNDVAYASFKIAEAHHKQIPDSWFLSPPAEERDQIQTHKTVRQLKRFLETYPKDPRVPKAEKLLRETLSLLAAHEMYVAKFYWRRDKPMAVIGRTQNILKNFRGASIEDEALWMLGESYRKVNKMDEAKTAYTELSNRFPLSPVAKQARKRLARMP